MGKICCFDHRKKLPKRNRQQEIGGEREKSREWQIHVGIFKLINQKKELKKLQSVDALLQILHGLLLGSLLP